MEADGIEHDGSTAAGGGGPAPFLLKTYEMVDDASTDDIVSWSPSMKSFVVWNHADFAASLLPTYFKHNNFSSFIRQLNTYGFRKIDPERWEFANEDFLKGHKHLLKNIRRRKPIHSHSLPPGGGLADAERTALEEEIDRLKREKDNLQATLWRFEQQNSGTENQLDDVERRLADMEQRQLKMIAFLQRAMLNPRIVENLVKMANSSSMDFSMIHKKRRLPPAMDFCQETSENNLGGEHCSTSRLELGHVLNQDFCDKLKLGLCSAFPDRGLAVASTESSNGGSGCSLGRQIDCDHSVMECLPLAPETLELCDTGASICPTKNLSVTREVDDDDGIFPCHLSLTLASSAMQIDRNECSSMTGNSIDLREANSMELDKVVATRENELSMLGLNNQRPAVDSNNTKVVPVQEAPVTSKEAPAVPPVRVNDLFWEQFLTERPGSSDTEEVSSSSRAYARNA